MQRTPREHGRRVKPSTPLGSQHIRPGAHAPELIASNALGMSLNWLLEPLFWSRCLLRGSCFRVVAAGPRIAFANVQFEVREAALSLEGHIHLIHN